jgi:hypothetical protein
LTSELVWKIWRGENSWPYRDSNFEPSVVQPVASRYTDSAILAPNWEKLSRENPKQNNHQNS